MFFAECFFLSSGKGNMLEKALLFWLISNTPFLSFFSDYFSFCSS